MGFTILHGVGISDALRNPNSTDKELQTLLEHGRTVLQQQGDLKSALAELEAEIAKRGG